MRTHLVWLCLLPSLLQSAMALDPFYTDDQVKEMVRLYKERKPLLPARQTHGLPLGLRMSVIKLPHFKVDDVSLAQALRELQKNAMESDAKLGSFVFLFVMDEVGNNSRITLDLKDLSFGEALRYVCQMGGVDSSLHGQMIVIEPFSAQTHGWWRGLGAGNYPLSEELAWRWFPEAKKHAAGDSGPLWHAEKELEKMGIPFNSDSTADFVPSMNVLSVAHCGAAHHCISVLVNEAESEIRIEAAAENPDKLPPGMPLRTFQLRDSDLGQMQPILAMKEGLLNPEKCVTTQEVIMTLGGIFPERSTAWFDARRKRLHVINTTANIEAIRKLMALDEPQS